MGSCWKVAWAVALLVCSSIHEGNADYRQYNLLPIDGVNNPGDVVECFLYPEAQLNVFTFAKTAFLLTPSVLAGNGDGDGDDGARSSSEEGSGGHHDGHHDGDDHRPHVNDVRDGANRPEKATVANPSWNGTAASMTTTTTERPPFFPPTLPESPCHYFYLSVNNDDDDDDDGKERVVRNSRAETLTQYAITIEKWRNGCFYVQNMDFPDDAESTSRACYVDGKFQPELSRTRGGDDVTTNPASSADNNKRSQAMTELVIVVYPNHDTDNLKFWWTLSLPDVDQPTTRTTPTTTTTPPTTRKVTYTTPPTRTMSTTLPSSKHDYNVGAAARASQFKGVEKKRDDDDDVDIGGRVVVTPYLVDAGGVDLDRVGCDAVSPHFAPCPGTGCLHVSFFCDGHFNCANLKVGDYDESWYICGWMMRRVILPTLSLLVLTLAAAMAVYLMKRRRFLVAGNRSRAFTSGTDSRRCSVHPLPLDPRSLQQGDNDFESRSRRKAQEAAASAGNTVTDSAARNGQRPRTTSSGPGGVVVDEQRPDLVPAYEHPPDYQTAMFQVPAVHQPSQPVTASSGDA